MLFKNIAGQKLIVFAYDVVADAPKTGDAANITANVSKDGVAGVASNDVNPAEIGGGLYAFDLSQAETNCDLFALYGSSTTANVKIEPVVAYTQGLMDDRLLAHPDAYVMVASSTTDAGRGTNLLAAYTAAKALTPNGGALSHTNRAAVLIPPGRYALGASVLTLNANFVDLFATHPEKGGDRLDSDDDYMTGGAVDPNTFRPPRTLIYQTGPRATIDQTVADVRMVGFGIANLVSNDAPGALKVSVTDNGPSVYDKMYIWQGWYIGSTIFTQHVGGLWTDCIANSFAWRTGVDGEFRATMIDCQAGSQSYGGDGGATGVGFAKCRLERCVGRGTMSMWNYQPNPPSDIRAWGCFGGCDVFGIPSSADSWFIDCEAGANSFSLGLTAAGHYIRCRGGNLCFGADASSYTGVFSGYAEDCCGGIGSFGGKAYSAPNANNYCSGTLVRCSVVGPADHPVYPTNLKGATIQGGLYRIDENNRDYFKLIDSLSKVHDATILVKEGGTGIPINDDGTARTVSAVGNRYNNLGATGTGLGALVTNRGNINVTLAVLIWAVVAYVRKQSASSDAIGANWFQDAAEATGITLPKVHVRKCSDGSVIVNDEAMTAVTGTTGSYRYVCTGAKRLDKGELYDIRFKATIGGVEYTRGPFKRSRDT